MVVFAFRRQGAVKPPHTGGVLGSVVGDMGSEKLLLFQRLSLLELLRIRSSGDLKARTAPLTSFWGVTL